MACWSRKPAWPKTCQAPCSIDATLPGTGVFQGCWHPRTAAPHPWSSANWPCVPWPFLPGPAGTLDHQGHLTPDAIQLFHGPAVAVDVEQSRQSPGLGLPLPVALLIIGGPETTTDLLWGWTQPSFHLLLHVLLGVKARGEVPIPQVSWVSPGLEGYQLLPFGPLGWIETSRANCLVLLDCRKPFISLYSVITASWSMAIASSISNSGAKTFCSNADLARSVQKDRGSGIRWRSAAIFCPRACCAKFCSLAFSMLV